MFKKIFDFIREYVIIEVVGKNKERFINMCLFKGVGIKNCVPEGDGVRIAIPRNEFKNIRSAVRKSGVRVRIIEKRGKRHFAKTHRKRVGFLAAGIIFIALMVVSSRYIWCVELDGIKRAERDEVIEILRKNGVYPGARKSKIADLGELKQDIIATDDINWAWLYIEGTKARLQIQETTPKPDIVDKTTPTDIIALCDGYITEATVKRGERRVNKGMAVAKGDVLISGKVPVYVEGTDERYSYVNADGVFYADTIRKETGKFSRKEFLRVKTGKHKLRLTLDVFGKHFDGIKSPEEVYDACLTDSVYYDLDLPFVGYTGISLGKHMVYEVNEVANTLAEDEVIDRARETLEERIMQGVGVGAQRLDENITYTRSGDTYIVTLTMYLRENIGIEIPRER